MATPETYNDPYFGDIVIRRSAVSRSVSLRVTPDGKLRASMPNRAPLVHLKRLIAGSSEQIEKMLSAHAPRIPLQDGMRIGKSHTLLVNSGEDITVKVTKSQIIVTKPADEPLDSPLVEEQLTPAIIKVLRQEAKAYLPRRLKYLADEHGFSYESVRFSHASSRWGSCSSRGTISLNIALMKLDFPLIDYVLVHELSHLRHMDHSAGFWSLVGSIDPDYARSRKILKTHNPGAYI